MKDNHVTTSTCDDCGTRAPGVQLHDCGAPVMFLCRSCDRRIFEAQARRDIDAWLAGGEIHVGR